jgi:hypothetical protein
MLQLILAFLAITIVSATGYSLVEQFSVQQKVIEQRENARRLDAVAKGIESNLIAIAGMEGAFAPSPSFAYALWSTVPDSIRGIKSSVGGSEFLYCPIGQQLVGNVPSLKAGLGKDEYGIEVLNNAVIRSEFGHSNVSNKNFFGMGVTAFVVAPRKGFSLRCNDINFSVSDNRFSIPNGLVRPIFQNGNIVLGLRPNDTRAIIGNAISIDQALAHWVKFNPQSFEIVISESVAVTNGPIWSAFLAELSSRRSQISFSYSTSNGNPASITFPPSYMNVASNLIIKSDDGILNFAGVNIVVKQGGQVSTQGSVVIVGNPTAPAIAVEQGGRLNSSGSLAMKGIDGTVINGVLSAGDVSLSSADVSSNGQWSMSFVTGGRLSTLNSAIGSSVNSIAGLLSAGAWSIVSDNSSQVRQSASGDCWKSVGTNDVTFAFSNNGIGASSSVTPDSAAPALSDPATPEELILFQEWRREVDGKQRSRQSNNSSFQCV